MPALSSLGFAEAEVRAMPFKGCCWLRDMLSRGLLCCRIGPGEMELGLGIHGEPGASKGPLKPVDEIVDLVRDPPP